MLTYALLYLFWFTVPGVLLLSVLGLWRSTTILFLPCSYLFVVVNLMAAKAFRIPVDWLVPIGVAEIAVLAAIWYARRSVPLSLAAAISVVESKIRQATEHSFSLIWIGGLLTAFAGYFLWAGPYTEVPSDFWSHAGKIQHNLLTVENTGRLPGGHGWTYLVGKPAEYWYAAQALLASAAGIDVETLIAPLAWINSMALVIAVFTFTARILCCAGYGANARLVIASFSAVLFVMHFGTSVFSFVRYYAFGPVLLNFIIYLGFVVVTLDFLGRSPHPKSLYPVLLIVLTALMAVIHLQEGMFAVVTGYALLTYFWIKRCVLGDNSTIEGVRDRGMELGARETQWLFLGTTAVSAVSWVAVHMYLDRSDPMEFNRLINLNEPLPFLKHLFVLHPGGQFYETVTPWGLLVLALVFVLWSRFRLNPVLVVGALSPFYTVFNPVFTDFFLRVSWPEVLWRLLYILPLPILGAVLLYTLGKAMVAARHPAARLAAGGLVTALIALLFPFNTTYVENSFSRIYTLKPVNDDNNYVWWSDLFQYLDTVEPARYVLTDPVTGYMLRTLTHHRHYGAKFHTIRWGGYRQFNRENYTLDSYRQYDDWLLVVNLRNGGPSRNGSLSRHWLGKQLQVSEYYEPEFLEFIDAHPEHFRKRWFKDDVYVFDIIIEPSRSTKRTGSARLDRE